MKMKNWLALALLLCLAVSLTACGSDESAVYVQSVASLANLGGIAPGDRFAGMGQVQENEIRFKCMLLR